MGCCRCTLKFFALVGLGVLGFVAWNHLLPPADIKVPTNGWYGSGKPRDDDTSIKPFSINVPDNVLQDLKSRLANSRISHVPLEDSDNFEYGFNAQYLKEVKDYWQNKFDWKKQEAALNTFPQFKTEIEGLGVHFIRSKPAAGYKTVLPLLIVHGWPGNVQEFVKIIPMLNDPKKFELDYDFAFEVIAPSIPGYGFSDSPKKTGFSQTECSRVFHKLMTRLGFKKYYLQGGDWGAIITANLARLYKDHILGIHLNMAPGFPRGVGLAKCIIGSFIPKLLFKSENYHDYSFFQLFKTMIVESGYLHLQATRPDTVGTGLNDSPIGLAAYILEKFSVWTNSNYKQLKDGGLTKKFTLDEVLTVITIYWTQENIVNSQRFYKEFFLDERTQHLASQYLPVPTGHSNFGHEPFDRTPSEVLEHLVNLVFRREHPDGGHFAALEMPKTLAGDVFEFVHQLRSPKLQAKPEL